MGLESYNASLKNLDVSLAEVSAMFSGMRAKNNADEAKLDQALEHLSVNEEVFAKLPDLGFHGVVETFKWDTTKDVEGNLILPQVTSLMKDHSNQAALTKQMEGQLTHMVQQRNMLTQLRSEAVGFTTSFLGVAGGGRCLELINGGFLPEVDFALERVIATIKRFEQEVNRRKPLLKKIGDTLAARYAKMSGMPFIPPPPPAAPAAAAAGGEQPGAEQQQQQQAALQAQNLTAVLEELGRDGLAERLAQLDRSVLIAMLVHAGRKDLVAEIEHLGRLALINFLADFDDGVLRNMLEYKDDARADVAAADQSHEEETSA